MKQYFSNHLMRSCLPSQMTLSNHFSSISFIFVIRVVAFENLSVFKFIVTRMLGAFIISSLLLCSIEGLNMRQPFQISSYSRMHSTMTDSIAESDVKGTAGNILEAWRKGYRDCPNEICKLLEGKLPTDLEGTLYRNGYGKFTIGKETVVHPFDSDGMITAITFKEGQALFRNRIVRTKGFLRERRARRILYRGAFGTSKKGFLSNIFDINLKNTANTHVLHWGDKLLALWEGGLPYRLEPDSLRTIGEYRFKGLLQPKQPFAAHYKIDPDTNYLINFSAQSKGTSATSMTVYEIDTKYDVQKQRTFDIDGFGLFHDFAITKNYYLFTRCPLSLNPIPFLLGQKGPAECIKFDASQPAEIYIVPRDSSQPVSVVKVDPHFNFHYANAYEETLPTGQTTINLDVVRCGKMVLGESNGSKVPIWQRIDYASEVPLSTLCRYSLTSGEGGQWGYEKKELLPQYLDFPIVNPTMVGKKAKYVYAAVGRFVDTPSPLQGIMKICSNTNTPLSQWVGDIDEFVTEASFAPRSNSKGEEDDGYILVLTSKSNSMTSELLIFDAKDLSIGPISRLPLPTYVPYGLHGMFAEKVTFDFNEVENKFLAFSALDKRNWNEMEGGFSGLGLKYEIY